MFGENTEDVSGNVLAYFIQAVCGKHQANRPKASLTFALHIDQVAFKCD